MAQFCSGRDFKSRPIKIKGYRVIVTDEMRQIDGFDVYGGGSRALDMIVLVIVVVAGTTGAFTGGIWNGIVFGCFMTIIAVVLGFRLVRRVWLSDGELRLDTLFASYTVPWSAVRSITVVPLLFPGQIKLRGVRISFSLSSEMEGCREVVRRIAEKVPTRT